MTEFKKQIYSGICVCSHHADRHTGNMVMNREAYRQTGESRYTGECLFYGFNEFTDFHCPQFWDKDNPEPDPHANQRPDPPSKEVR
jgi:hypothetical protein